MNQAAARLEDVLVEVPGTNEYRIDSEKVASAPARKQYLLESLLGTIQHTLNNPIMAFTGKAGQLHHEQSGLYAKLHHHAQEMKGQVENLPTMGFPGVPLADRLADFYSEFTRTLSRIHREMKKVRKYSHDDYVFLHKAMDQIVYGTKQWTTSLRDIRFERCEVHLVPYTNGHYMVKLPDNV